METYKETNESALEGLNNVYNSVLKERFDTLLLHNKMRQVDLASKIGVSKSYINMVIHEKCEVSPKLRLKIAKALGVDSYVLWRGF